MAKTLAIVFGIIIVIVGVLGFVPNPIVGEGAAIATSMALNVLYIVLGLVLLGAGVRMPAQAGLWLKIVGVVYVIAAVAGFLVAPNGGVILGVFTVNVASNLLHVVLGVVLLVAGFVAKDGSKSAAMPVASSMPSGPSTGGTISIDSVKSQNGNLILTWTGGTAPFKVEKKLNVDDPAWTTATTTSERTASVPITGDHAFFRVTH